MIVEDFLKVVVKDTKIRICQDDGDNHELTELDFIKTIYLIVPIGELKVNILVNSK